MSKKEKNKPDDTSPIKKHGEIKQNPDPGIDQDFKNFPDHPANHKNIKPGTENEKKTAGMDDKDGEKMNKQEKKKAKKEQDSDGSANAFEGTEKVTGDEDKNEGISKKDY